MPEFGAILTHGEEPLWDCLATRWYDSGESISAQVSFPDMVVFATLQQLDVLLLLLLNG